MHAASALRHHWREYPIEAALHWQHLWIYFTAPPLGMLAASQLVCSLRGSGRLGCAKLLHPDDQRCIHCGYEPAGEVQRASVQAPGSG